jgi:chromosome segregation ATPase
MEKVIEVLSKQSTHNSKTMDTIEAHEDVLNSTLESVKKHTKLINETVEWTSALTEGLENHQEVLDKHQAALTKSLELDKKQGEALEKHQDALESQQGVLNKTVKWVGALSEGMEAHQEALEKHQESLITDLMETAKNTQMIQGHQDKLTDATGRLESLEHKDAKRLTSLGGEEVLYATKAEVNESMVGVEDHLRTAEANMVAINRRTLATKQLATLLHKHTNTLDANVQHMKEALDATTVHGQSNMKMLHTIEANEKEARHDIKKGVEKLAELHHQANVFEQNQNTLRMSAHSNSQAVRLLEHGQAQHKKDLKSLKEHGKLLDHLVSETNTMASSAEQKAHTLMEEKDALSNHLHDLAAKFEAVTSGSQNKKRMQELQSEANALKMQQKASQAKIDEALTMDQMSVKIANETTETQQAVADLSDKTADIELHQEKMVKTTAFGLMCVVIAVFFLACFMMGQLRRLNEKIEHTTAGRARGSGN